MLNKVMLIGNLGRDPELRYTAGGQAVCDFSIATTESYTDRDGQKQDKTEWHRIVVWAKQAENCKRFLSKGSKVFVEGKLQTRDWEDKSGVKRSTTEIVAQSVQFLSSKGQSGGSSGGYEGPPPPSDMDAPGPGFTASEPRRDKGSPASSRPSYKAEEMPPLDDDLPF